MVRFSLVVLSFNRFLKNSPQRALRTRRIGGNILLCPNVKITLTPSDAATPSVKPALVAARSAPPGFLANTHSPRPSLRELRGIEAAASLFVFGFCSAPGFHLIHTSR